MRIIFIICLCLYGASANADDDKVPVSTTEQNKILTEKALEGAREVAKKVLESCVKRPCKRFVAITMEPRFGHYVEKSLRKILQISTSNYPSDARGIFGQVQLTMTIQSDGALENIEINKSSGQKVLDEAAVRFVHQAAPFDPFPDDIRIDTDVLSVTRTFTFTASDDKRYLPDEPLWKLSAPDKMPR